MSQFDERSAGDEGVGLSPWDPNRYLRGVDSMTARLSRGFLRCRPEKWFPGFAGSWLPLAHSLGVEMKMVEAKPVMSAPKGMENGFAATIDDEPLGLYVDDEATRTLLDVVCPGADDSSRKVILEYLARRLLTTLEMSWSGPESSVVRFDTEMDPSSIRNLGAVKFTIAVNGNPCAIWVLLGKILIERLDGLWRRQIQSSARQEEGAVDLHLEIAQLAVPPSMLSDYMKSGTVVDLEVPTSESIVLRSGGKPWLPAKLCNVDGILGFEIESGPVAPTTLPEGTTRLSIEFGSVQLDPAQVSEMSQIGATWETQIELGNTVAMVVNGESVGKATLCTYEGRFAISVL